jgi:hypothetical protein
MNWIFLSADVITAGLLISHITNGNGIFFRRRLPIAIHTFLSQFLKPLDKG